MVRAFLMLLCAGLAATAQAQTHKVGGGCEPLDIHQPADDVHVRDGVDAQGWAIPPADLTPPTITKDSFDPVGIALDVPLSDYINQEHYNYNASEADIWLGRVNVGMDGQVDYNRQRIGGAQTYNPECDTEKK